MIPTAATSLSFWEKFFELHYKMMFATTESVQNHMYSSVPLEWPLMSRGIAYWVSSDSNVSITAAYYKQLIIDMIKYVLGSNSFDGEHSSVVYSIYWHCALPLPAGFLSPKAETSMLRPRPYQLGQIPAYRGSFLFRLFISLLTILFC